MQNEISNLRKEKDNLLMERNDTRLNLMKDLDQEKIKNKLMANDFEKIGQMNKNMDHELNIIKEKGSNNLSWAYMLMTWSYYHRPWKK